MKSFILQTNLEAHDSLCILNSAKGVWMGLAPPKAKLLSWLVLLERLNTKDRLKKFHIIAANDSTCSLCNHQEEIVAHLFCHYYRVWKVWSSRINWWGLHWCCPSCPSELFQTWLGVNLSGFQKKVWCSLFYAII